MDTLELGKKTVRLVKKAEIAKRSAAEFVKLLVPPENKAEGWVSTFKAEKAARNPRRDWELLFKSA